MRWITVGPAGQPGTSILLAPPVADPGVTDDERRTIAEMMAKGTFGWIMLATTDLNGTFEQVQASGAEVVQEPTEQPYGTATAHSAIPRATWSASRNCAEPSGNRRPRRPRAVLAAGAPGRGQSAYRAPMTSAYFPCTTRRLSLKVGVSSSLSAVHSTGSSRHLLTCWTGASRWFAPATASATAARTAGSPASSASEDASIPRALAQPAPRRHSGSAAPPRTAAGLRSERLADQRMGDEQVLDRGRRDVLPARGDDEVLLAVHDGQEAVAVQ